PVPPPLVVEELPEQGLVVVVSVALPPFSWVFEMPPPPNKSPGAWAVELPDRVLPLTVSVAVLAMPPPHARSVTKLPDRVLLATVIVPSFSMPPPPWPGGRPWKRIPRVSWAELSDTLLV